jgi:hypothetical protein
MARVREWTIPAERPLLLVSVQRIPSFVFSVFYRITCFTCCLLHAGFLFGLFLNCCDRGTTFLWMSADFQQTTQHYIPADRTLHSYCCENTDAINDVQLHKWLNIQTGCIYGANIQITSSFTNIAEIHTSKNSRNSLHNSVVIQTKMLI